MEVEALQSMGHERDRAIKLLREYADRLPEDLAERTKLELVLADLTDALHSRNSS